MSWSSKSLPWLIPNLLLTAPTNGTAVFVSPWVEDVTFQISRWEGQQMLDGDCQLTATLRWLNNERGMTFEFYVRADQMQPTMNSRLVGVYQAIRDIAVFHGIPDLHAKLLVTDAVVLETSANLLRRSLYTNVETVSVVPNQDADAKKYARGFFLRHGVLSA